MEVYVIEDESAAAVSRSRSVCHFLSTMRRDGGAAAPLAPSVRGEVGKVLKAGRWRSISQPGEPIWSRVAARTCGTRGCLHFVWKNWLPATSDCADIRLLGASAHPHRKAAWIIRQSLDPDRLRGCGASWQRPDRPELSRSARATTRENSVHIAAPGRLRTKNAATT